MINTHMQPGHTMVAAQNDRSTPRARTRTLILDINKEILRSRMQDIFGEQECRVYYKDKLVLSGSSDKKTEM